MVRALVTAGKGAFETIRLRTHTKEASRFYEHLGFVGVEALTADMKWDGNVTHWVRV